MSERTCPNCKQPISDPDALLCHFCGSSLGRASSGLLGKISASKLGIAVIVLVVILILALGR